jgi:predicted phosphodiesterase
MRIAIFSDVHGNISGLRAILHAIDDSGGADMLVAAGDLVGGGPGTEDLLDLLQERQVRLLRGNAEETWLDMDAAWNQMQRIWQMMEPERDFDHERTKWMQELRPTAAWMRQHLSQPYWDLLAQLPQSITVEIAQGRRLMVCHATPESTWPPITAPSTPVAELREAYGQVDAEVIAFGHVHRHYVRQLDAKLLVNVASVMGRADIPGHSAFTWLVFEQEHWLVQQMLVPYDVEEEAGLISERRVPPL